MVITARKLTGANMTVTTVKIYTARLSSIPLAVSRREVALKS